jgi:hypothetical protein
MKTIYFLEGRGEIYPYHFYILLLGGLYYIINEINHRGNDNSTIKFFDNSKITNERPELKYPIEIFFGYNTILPYHLSALDIIKDKFKYINISELENYKIFSEYGETLDKNPYSDNPEKIFPFIRNLFLKNEKNIEKEKRIFITRKGSENHHKGVSRRIILNENNFYTMLKKYNFEYIQLENYSEEEKINMFNTSEIIVSSHSSGLIYCLFSNEHTKIIEILNKGEKMFPNDHYKNICSHLKLNYRRYNNINENTNGNFNINVNDFEKYLINIL